MLFPVRGLGTTYGVDLQVPWFAGFVEVDKDFFILDAEFGKRNVYAVGVGTAVVGVEGDFVAFAHDVTGVGRLEWRGSCMGQDVDVGGGARGRHCILVEERYARRRGCGEGMLRRRLWW